MTGFMDQVVMSTDQPGLVDLCVKKSTPIAGFFSCALLFAACLFMSPAWADRTLREGETRRGEDLEFESEAIYLVYRTPRSLFVSLRGGIAWDKVVIDGNSSRDDGLLFGAGFGIVAGKTLIQIEYTSIAGDANFLSLSLEF